MQDESRFQHIRRAVHSTVWALQPEKLEDIVALLALRASGITLTEADVRQRLNGEPPPRRQAASSGAVAVIPVFGIIARRMNLMSEFSGGTSTEQLTSQIRDAIANPQIQSIALVVDSPGGSTDGVTELAAVLREARQRKRIVAAVDSLAASAGYWLASQATEITCTPSGHVGAIGVMATHQSIAGALQKAGIETTIIASGEFKTEGNPYEPLTDAAKAAMHGLVANAYRLFLEDVAKGRGTSPTAVKAGYGKGRLLSAEDARAAGMVDRIEPLDQTLSRLQTTPAARPLAAHQVGAALRAGDPLWWPRMQIELLKL